MRKTAIKITIAIFFALITNSCSNYKLKTIIVELDKQCPIAMEDGLQIANINTTNDDITFVINVDEERFSFGEIKNIEDIKAIAKENLRSQSPQITKLAIETNRKIIYKYIGNQTQVNLKIAINTEELNSIFTNNSK